MFMLAKKLWTYPKNHYLIRTQFKKCKKYCSGRHLWEWIGKIAALKEEKIVWDNYLDVADKEIFILSVDCMDLRTWEPSTHPFYNQDCEECSHKHKHAAKQFEIALALFHNQVAWISGPHSAGSCDDRTIFCQVLKGRIMEGKLVIADS